MTSSAPTPANPQNGHPERKTLGVAAIGYAFMGKAHSNAWRNVASSFDVPAIEQKVLVGRDSGQVAAAAARYGWAESKPSTGQLRVLDCQGIAEFGAPFDSPDS